MAVDPQKPRKILVVHGVQTGTDADQNQHELIRELVADRLNGIPLNFETDIYRYENINDTAQQSLRNLLSLFLNQLKLRTPADFLADLVGDVVLALEDGSTAQQIRAGLRRRVEETFAEGNPLYILAHSLGSIYAFDVINELIKTAGYFDRNSRRTWPVQGFVSIGSPIGLSLFNRTKVERLGAGTRYLRWSNYWDRTDPIVSGSIFGLPAQGYNIAERFTDNTVTSGWFIQDHVVDIGSAWLMAHVGYWHHAAIGDDLATMIAN